MDNVELKIMDDMLEKVAVLTRIVMDERQITKDEAIKMTVDCANRNMNKVFAMNQKQFVLFCMSTFIDMAQKIEGSD